MCKEQTRSHQLWSSPPSRRLLAGHCSYSTKAAPKFLLTSGIGKAPTEIGGSIELLARRFASNKRGYEGYCSEHDQIERDRPGGPAPREEGGRHDGRQPAA